MQFSAMDTVKTSQVLFSLLWCTLMLADSPRETPSNKKIFSPNGKFFALLDAAHKTTTVYRAGRPGGKLWEMPGWHAATFLANDGDHLVIGYEGINLLELDTKADEPMITLYNRAKKVCTVQLDQLIKDRSKLMRTDSHVVWGDYLGFNRQGDFLVRTGDGTTYVLSHEGQLRSLKK
jgi:hypothetical protein